jgi:hypothetical protein
MGEEDFSQRYGFRPQPEPQPYDEVPGWLRDAFYELISEYRQDKDNPYLQDQFGWQLYRAFKPLIWKVLNRQPPGEPRGGPWAWYIPEVISKCEWWRFYDICQTVYKLVHQAYGREDAETFAKKTNDLFREENVVWRFINGRIERGDDSIVSTKVQEARTLLKDPRFQGPDEEFEKAISALSARPEPDTRNCVARAVSALEGVARIVYRNPKATLGDLLKTHLKGAMHSALYKTFEGLWGYASDEARHGLVGENRIYIEEAELVMSMCAPAIIYLAKKAGPSTNGTA